MVFSVETTELHSLAAAGRRHRQIRLYNVCNMNNPATGKLYVNLSASQTRKRLKGFGHGVKKVQAAGANQAVIIHTATGQHLRELQNLLADALPESNEEVQGEHFDEPSGGI